MDWEAELGEELLLLGVDHAPVLDFCLRPLSGEAMSGPDFLLCLLCTLIVIRCWHAMWIPQDRLSAASACPLA